MRAPPDSHEAAVAIAVSLAVLGPNSQLSPIGILGSGLPHGCDFRCGHLQLFPALPLDQPTIAEVVSEAREKLNVDHCPKALVCHEG